MVQQVILMSGLGLFNCLFVFWEKHEQNVKWWVERQVVGGEGIVDCCSLPFRGLRSVREYCRKRAVVVALVSDGQRLGGEREREQRRRAGRGSVVVF